MTKPISAVLNGEACYVCRSEFGSGGSSVPTGTLDGRQLFVCDPPCSEDAAVSVAVASVYRAFSSVEDYGDDRVADSKRRAEWAQNYGTEVNFPSWDALPELVRAHYRAQARIDSR